MAISVNLLSWTDQGIRNIKDAPQRRKALAEHCEKHGVRIREQLNTIGPYNARRSVHRASERVSLDRARREGLPDYRHYDHRVSLHGTCEGLAATGSRPYRSDWLLVSRRSQSRRKYFGPGKRSAPFFRPEAAHA